MAGIQLQAFLPNDTDYVAKLNTNNGTLTNAVNQLQTAVATNAQNQQTLSLLILAMLGTSPALLGSNSAVASVAGNNLTISAGYLWKASAQKLVQQAAPVNLSLVGQAAGTYYVDVDSSGNTFLTQSPVDPLYSVVWNGNAYGVVSRMANLLFNSADENAATVSAKFNKTLTSLSTRLTAVEAALP